METVILTKTQNDLKYQFADMEVLKSADQVQRRKDSLYLALILGNNYNKVVKLNAITSEGTVNIEGIILAMTEDYVILKGGGKIPVICIEEVRIY